MSLPLLQVVVPLESVVEKVLPGREGLGEHPWSSQQVLRSEELRGQRSGG